MKKQAFTLIELLVVIAIISVLAALLMPALRGALEAARTISCQSNLRQAALTIAMYTDDHGGFMPYLSDKDAPVIKKPSGDAYNGLEIIDFLYLDNKNLFRCPSDDEVNPANPYNQYKTSYGIPGRTPNISVFSKWHKTDPSRRRVRRQGDFAKPSQYMMLADAGALSVNTSNYTSWIHLRPGANGQIYEGQISTRHHERPNIAFLDGHMKTEDTWIVQFGRENSEWIFWWEE